MHLSRVFPGCFPGVSRHNFFFSLTLLKIPTTFAKEVFFLNLLLLCKTLVNAPFLGVSRVFPGCSRAQFFFSFTLLKIPTTFAKEVFF